MPLYEYECTKNGHRFELIRKFSDPPLRTCIHCKSKVRKLISSSAIAFKGSGWYVNDYGRGRGSGNGQKSGSKTDSGSETKSEAKVIESPGGASAGEKAEKAEKAQKDKGKGKQS